MHQNVGIARSPGYLGVETPVLIAIGKVVVAAGRVEAAADNIAFALGLDEAGLQFSILRSKIERKLSRDGVPADSRAEDVAIREWLANVKDALEDRNRLFHSGFALMRESDPWVPYHEHLRTRVMYPVSIADFEALASRLATLANEATALFVGLSGDRMAIRPMWRIAEGWSDSEPRRPSARG